jgi:cyclohexanecarboxylate-CoA ligase
MADAESWPGVRPSAGLARRYRAQGFWRDLTPAGDLRRWARETPDAVAVTAHRAGLGARQITYREYADQVDRAAGVLAGLGVGPGDVVTVQLPDWWQLHAVVLACARLGAIAAPFVTTIRARELELILSRLRPVAHVTTQAWDGYDHSAALAAVADRLPSLRHRIIVGGHVAPGEIDLERRIEQARTTELGTDYSAEDPDRVSMPLFTSGTTGSPKAALHSFNTLYASYTARSARRGLSPADVIFTPHTQSHMLGQTMTSMLPLYLGAQALITDTWNPETAVRLLAEYGATYAIGAPVFIDAIVRTARALGQKLPRLRQIDATATTVPVGLAGLVSDATGVTLGAGWGMTEIGAGAATAPGEDPPDWTARSIGRPFACMETDLRSGTEVSPGNPGRLFVRGANVCLATVPRDGGELSVLAEKDDGWYDTGDLAVPDERGGLRLMGRAADRIGGLFMIPAADVEDTLRRHPDIDDAALVGYGPGNELACAVVVSRKALTLADVRAYLDGVQMTAWYQPGRLELIDQLPRNANGKVDKHHLRAWLTGF